MDITYVIISFAVFFTQISVITVLYQQISGITIRWYSYMQDLLQMTYGFYIIGCLFFRSQRSLHKIQFVHRIKSAIDYTLASAGETLSQESFHLETSLSQIQVPLKKNLYFETSPTVHKVILHTIDERIEFYATISEIEKKVMATIFI